MKDYNNQFGKYQKMTLTVDGELNTIVDDSPYTIFEPKNAYEFWKRLKVDDNGNVVIVTI